MTLAATTNRVDYVANGATSVYPYTFRVFLNTDLLVTKRLTSSGVQTTLVLTTDYTVSGVGDSGGGNVTLVAGALESGYTLTLRRVRALTQLTDIRNQGSFYPETHEDVFDHLMMIDQQQQDALDRSVTLPESIDDAAFNPTLPTVLTANRVLAVNPAGTGWVMSATASDAAPYLGAGYIAPTVFAIANNQSATNVTGLLLASSVSLSAVFEYHFVRSTRRGRGFYYAAFDGTNWIGMDQEEHGIGQVFSGITLSMTTAGQLQYASDNHVSGSITINVRTTNV